VKDGSDALYQGPTSVGPLMPAKIWAKRVHVRKEHLPDRGQFQLLVVASFIAI
jgi:hypothetical protein